VEGARSLAIANSGNTTITSGSLGSLGPVADKLTLDLLLPANQPNPSWMGSVKLVIECPSQQLWSEGLAEHQLQGKPTEQFLRFEFPLPASTRSKLSTGSYTDLRFKVLLNVASGPGPWLLDRLWVGDPGPGGSGGSGGAGGNAGASGGGQAGSGGAASASEPTLGFEDPANWTTDAGALASSDTRVEGQHSVQVSNIAYAEITSKPLSTLTAVGSVLGFDLSVPNPIGDVWWWGSAAISLDCPSRGINSRWLGQQQLDGSTLDRFRRVEVTLPDDVKSALTSGSYTDLRVKIILNVPQGSGPYLLDRFTFAQQLPEPTPPGPSEALIKAVGFETLEAWKASSGTLALSSNALEGSSSLSLSGFTYTELTSQRLSSLGPQIDGPLMVNVWVPTPPNPGWVGTLGLSMDLPSKGIYAQSIGHHYLGGLAPNTRHRLKFELPQATVLALRGNYDDLRIKLLFNRPEQLGALLVDELTFPNLKPLPAAVVEDYVVPLPKGMAFANVAVGQSLVKRSRFRPVDLWSPNSGGPITVLTPFVQTANVVAPRMGRTGGDATVTVGSWTGDISAFWDVVGGPITGTAKAGRDAVAAATDRLSNTNLESFEAGRIHVEYPADLDNRQDITAFSTGDGFTHELPPGDYGFVTVSPRNGGTFVLRSGVYRMRGLYIGGETPFIRADNTQGPIIIHVRDSLDLLSGTWARTASHKHNVLMTYSGKMLGPVRGFDGTLIAPRIEKLTTGRDPFGQGSLSGAVFVRAAELTDSRPIQFHPFERDDCAVQPNNGCGVFGCNTADADADGLYDCEEQPGAWADPSTFNGVRVRASAACQPSGADVCSGIDTLAEIDACAQNPALLEEQKMYSGWELTGRSIRGVGCQDEVDFWPPWPGCTDAATASYDYRGFIQLAEDGVHCFAVQGTESNVCGALFFDAEEQAVTSATGTLCFDRAAGIYPVRWFIDAPAAGLADSVRVSYCPGGAAECQPTQAIPQAMLRPTIGAGEPGVKCSVNADCVDGLACLRSRGGVCVDPYTPIRDCDVNADCATLLLCSQRGECTPPGESCSDNADCTPDWLCTSARACVPKNCSSLDPDENPCLKPENFGKQTACGICNACVPRCDGRSCGDNGCGGVCGTCPAGDSCVNGDCLGNVNVVTAPEPHPPLVAPPTEQDDEGIAVGEVPGSFDVSSSGEAMYRVPLVVPPGRGGLTPKLALSYSSGRGNGYVGLGWSLEGLSSITRCNKTIAQDGVTSAPYLSINDAFCLDGQRLILVADRSAETPRTLEYRTEVETFARVTAYLRAGDDKNPVRFQVERKDGLTLSYGATPDSNIGQGVIKELIGQGAILEHMTHTWAVNEFRDRAGNFMEVRYHTKSVDASFDGGAREYFPVGITYGLHDANDGAPAHVVFNYEDRPDALTGFKNGYEISISRLLKSIEMYAGPGAFRRYQLEHNVVGPVDGQGQVNGRSVLKSVTECAKPVDAASFEGAPCKAPLVFEYHQDVQPRTSEDFPISGVFSVGDGAGVRAPLLRPGGGKPASLLTHTLDLNGDGVDDFLIPVSHASHGPSHDPSYSFGQDYDCVNPVDPDPTQQPNQRAPCKAEWYAIISGNDGTYQGFETNIPLQREIKPEQKLTDPRCQPYGSDEKCPFTWDRFCMGQGIVMDIDNDGAQELLEIECDDEGIAQKNYSVITARGGIVHRQELPNIKYGRTGSTDDTTGWRVPNGTSEFATAYVLDVDGDGLKDILECHARDEWTLYRNTGHQVETNNFMEGVAVHIPAWCRVDEMRHDVLDVDGDGREELVIRRWLGDDQDQILIRIDGNDATFPRPTNLPKRNSLAEGPRKVMDINGDGLMDLMEGDVGGIALLLNRGDGNFSAHVLQVPDLGWRSPGNTNTMAVLNGAPMDVDGDGRQDLVVAGNPNWMWLRSIGTGFVTEQFPENARVPSKLGEFWEDTPVLADLDADSFLDILTINRDQVWKQVRFSGPAQAELVAVTDSLGARLAVDYLPLRHRDGFKQANAPSCAFPMKCERQSSRRVVSKAAFWDLPYTADAPPTAAREVEYFYQFPRTDLPRHSWLGFGERRVDEYAYTHNGRELISRTDFSVNFAYDSLLRIFPFAHRPYWVDHYTFLGEGHYRREQTHSVQATRTAAPSHAGTVFVFDEQQSHTVTERSAAGERLLSQTVKGFHFPDEFGNFASVEQVFSTEGKPYAESVSTDTEYLHTSEPGRVASWQIDLPRQITTTSYVSALSAADENEKVRQQLFTYYPSGLVHHSIRAPFGLATEKADTEIVRDVFGNVTRTTITDGNGNSRTHTVEYDEYGFLPVAIINGKQQRAELGLDARFGQVVRAVDPNKVLSRVWYDDFGRPRLLIEPGEVTTEWSYQRTGEPALPTEVRQIAEGGETTTRYDVLGRVAQSERTALGGNLFQNLVYDTRGNLVLAERPHRLSMQSAEAFVFSYDNLNRVLDTAHPDGGTTTSCYQLNTACTRDGRGFSHCTQLDWVGRLEHSIDPGTSPVSCADALAQAPNTVHTRYTYGPFGDIRRVKDRMSQERSWDTDDYGRVEQLSDPDLGDRSFTYNGLDDLTTLTSEDGTIIDFKYDALGRIERRSEKEPSLPWKVSQWIWDGDGVDVPGELIGSLTQTKSADGHTRTFHYDPATARLQGMDLHLAGESSEMHARFSYTDAGLLDTITYPSISGLPSVLAKHSYDVHGHLLAVEDPTGVHAPQGHFWKVDDSAPTDAYGQLRSEHFGNGVNTKREYWPQGHLKSLQSAVNGSGTIQHLDFNVDHHGNIRTRIDHIRGQWESFGYDQLDRVACSRVGSGAIQDMKPGCPTRNEPPQDHYSYDAIGRLQSSPEGTYIYGSQVQHAPESLEGASGLSHYSYDTRGNRVREQTSFVRRYAYTPTSKLKEVWREGQTPDEKLDLVSIDYDASDTRIKKTTPSLTTAYLDGLYERRTPAGGASEHVFFVRVGGSVIAEIKPTAGDSSDTKYLLSDHLGSPHLLTGENGQVLDELSFTAFGKRRNAQWANTDPLGPALSTISYTGHEADDDIGLINMRGRQYDPKLGQFIQPDPIVQAPDFSQSWNRYAYVFNNPLKFVDPTGYQTSGSEEGSGSSDEGEGEPSYQGERAYGPIVVNPQVYRMGATHHTRTGSVASETSRATAPVDFGMESARTPAITETPSQSQTSDRSASMNTGHPAADAPGNNTESGGETNQSSGHSGWPSQRPLRNLDLLNEATKQIPDTSETWNRIGEGLELATNLLPTPGGAAKAATKAPGWIKGLWGWARRVLGFSDDAARAAARAGAMAGRRLGHTFTKHGADNTAQLLKEAAGSGKPVGQWLDNAKAEQFIADRLGQLKNGARTFDLPQGLGRVVNPDGTFSAATKARLVPSGSGVKTAFPLIE
jgi:RHS repeat-associated protein